MKQLIFILILFLSNYLNFFIFAQNELPESITTQETVYDENIYLPRLLFQNQQPSYPFIHLNKQEDYLVLNFDELNVERANDFTYRIVHCNADWSLSGLQSYEFIDGFNEADIDDYRFSNGTNQEYVNYRLTLPNAMTEFKASGNYLLYVFRDGDEENPAFSLRFVVYETALEINEKLSFSTLNRYFYSNQQLEFSFDYQQFAANILPSEDFTVNVLQNGRWDNALIDLPSYFMDRKSVYFRHHRQEFFKAATEFRSCDLRFLNNGNNNENRYFWQNAYHHIALPVDSIFTHQIKDTDFQMRGKYYTDNFDRRLNAANEDYVWAHFQLSINDSIFNPNDYNVFLFGELTNWQLNNPNFQLKWRAEKQVYKLTNYLKQGIYNYQYVAISKEKNDEGQFETLSLEGDYWNRFNDYFIFIYFRKYGDRADRIIGATWLQTNR